MKIGLYKRINFFIKELCEFCNSCNFIYKMTIDEESGLISFKYQQENDTFLTSKETLSLEMAIGGFNIFPGVKLPKCNKTLSNLAGEYVKVLSKKAEEKGTTEFSFSKFLGPKATESNRKFKIDSIYFYKPILPGVGSSIVKFKDAFDEEPIPYQCESFWFLVFTDLYENLGV